MGEPRHDSVRTVVVPECAEDAAALLAVALDSGCEWLWLQAPNAAPRPGALEEMLEAAGKAAGMPPPLLIASKVVAPDGSLERGSLPVVEVFRADLALAALERRLLMVRAARPGSLLVRRRAFEGRPLPRLGSGLDYLAWTADLLKDDLGLLAPTSVVRLPAGKGARAELGRRVKFVTGGSLEPRERPWFAFHLAEEALAIARRGGRAGRPPR